MRKEMRDFCKTKPEYECKIMSFKFEAISSYEEKIGKHCENFTVEEILEFYISLQTTSAVVLQVYNTYGNNFCKYIGAEGNFSKISNAQLTACVNKELVTSKLVTRQDLLSIISYLNNPVEKAISLCLFEGICGKGYSELYAIKASDISGNTILLNSGRKLDISDELKSLILDACGEFNYYSYTENERMEIKPFKADSIGMIKELYNVRTSTPNDYFTIRKRVYTIILRAKNMAGSDSIDATNLRESGRIEMIKALLDAGKSLEEVLRDPNMEYRYGRINNKATYIELYNDYFRED